MTPSAATASTSRRRTCRCPGSPSCWRGPPGRRRGSSRRTGRTAGSGPGPRGLGGDEEHEGGSSETLEKDWQVRPTGWSRLVLVTTVTPDAKRPRTSRNRRAAAMCSGSSWTMTSSPGRNSKSMSWSPATSRSAPARPGLPGVRAHPSGISGLGISWWGSEVMTPSVPSGLRQPGHGTPTGLRPRSRGPSRTPRSTRAPPSGRRRR